MHNFNEIYLYYDVFITTGIGSFGILISVIRSTRIQKYLSKSIIKFLGKISYPLYLIHAMFIGLFLKTIETLETNYGLSVAFYIVIFEVLISSMISAYLIHIFIEEKFIKIGKSKYFSSQT